MKRPQQIIQVVQEAPPPVSLTVPIEEAARMLSMGRSLFYELLGTGAIKGIKINRKVIIPISEINAFLERNLGAALTT